MINIQNLSECDQLIDDPELQREVTSYLLYCHHELQMYTDEDDPDSQDFRFSVLAHEDLPMLNDLGPPEEVARIDIKMGDIIQTIYRIVYVSQVLFIPAEISDQFSF